MGGSTNTSESKLAGIIVQTSLLGQPIPIGWGRSLVSCNLIDYVGFKAKQVNSSQGGKGGGSNTSYNYSASIIMAICEGPIIGVRSVYRDSTQYTLNHPKSGTALAQTKLSLAKGTLTQAPWGYLTSLFPDHAIGYSTLAYVYAQDYALGSGATLPNHSFEVDFSIQFGPNGDADPKDITVDYLTNVSYGVTGWGASLIGDLSDWSLYCRAANLLLSPVISQSTTGSDFLTQISMEANSEFFWSEGVLKAKSYGDATITGNSVTWNPGLTPIFDLTEDDFLSEVTQEIVDQSDAYNYIQLEYLDRNNQYQPAIAIAHDLDNIVTFGLRKKDVIQVHDICDAQIAQHAAQLMLQRILYVRDRFSFDLPEDFSGLEPMDYVTLTTTVDGLELNRQLVLLDEVNQNKDGTLSLTATGVDGLTANAALYVDHQVTTYQQQPGIPPGSVTAPAIFIAPYDLTNFEGEVWIAASGPADTWGGCEVWASPIPTGPFQELGLINSPARYGVLSSDLPDSGDPDNTNILTVDLTNSNGGVLVGTTADAMNAGATLCYVDGEIIGYQDATLTSAEHYSLSPLRRALEKTSHGAHAAGSMFARIDSSIYRLPYGSLAQSGMLYLKLPSFNIYGAAVEQLSDVATYSIALPPVASRYTQQQTEIEAAATAASAAQTAVTAATSAAADATAAAGNALAAANLAATAAHDATVAAAAAAATANTASSDLLTEVSRSEGAEGTLTTSIANLTSTVSTNYGTLSSSVNSEALARSTADDTLSALVTSLTSYVTVNPNLVINPTGALGTDYWVNVQPTPVNSVKGVYGEGYFFQATSGSDSSGVGCFEDIPFTAANGSISIQAKIFAGGLTSSSFTQARVYVQWLDGSGGHLGYTLTAVAAAGQGWTYATQPNQVAPTGVATMRVWRDIYSAGSWTNANTAWKEIKIEGGPVCTAYTDNATTAEINASILNEAATRASADISLATDITTLTTNYGTLSSTVSTNYTTLSNATSTVASDLTTLTSTVGTNDFNQSANLTAEGVTRANADSSLSSDITTLQSNYGNLSSTVSSNYTTLSNATSTVAANLLTLTSTVGGNSSNITSLLSTTSTLTGQQTSTAVSVTALQALTNINPNLLANPTGALGMNNWSANGAEIIYAELGNNGEGYYFQAFSGSDTSHDGFFEYQRFNCNQYVVLSLQAYMFSAGLTPSSGQAYVRVFLDYRNSSDANIGYSVLAIPSGLGWSLAKLENQQTPAGTTSVVVWMDITGNGGSWTNTNSAWKKIKVENGPVCTLYTDDATPASIDSKFSNDIVVLSGLQSTQASDITNLQSNYGTLNGSVSTLSSNYTTLSNAQSSTASDLTTLTSTVGGHTSSINSLFSTTSTITGQLSATAGLTLNVNGNISGFYNYNDGTTSSFVVDAASFIIKDSSHPNATPFYFDGSTGALHVDSVSANTVNVGSITAGDVSGTINSGGGVAANQVSTVSVLANAISNILSISSSPVTWSDPVNTGTSTHMLASGTYTPSSTASNILLIISVSGFASLVNSSSHTASSTPMTLTETVSGKQFYLTPGGTSLNGTTTMQILLTGVSGAQTFTVNAQINGGGSSTNLGSGSAQCVLTVLELKK